MKVTLKESNFEPLPDGVYRLIVMDCTRQKKKDSSEEFNSWKLQVNEDSEFNERTISLATNPETINAQYASFLKACGLPTDDLNLKEGIEIDTNDFIGCELFAEVKVGTNSRGGSVNKFVWFKSIEEYQKQIEQASQKFTRPAKSAAPAAQQPAAATPAPAAQQPAAAPAAPAAEETTVKPAGPVRPNAKPTVPVTTGKKLDFPA